MTKFPSFPSYGFSQSKANNCEISRKISTQRSCGSTTNTLHNYEILFEIADSDKLLRISKSKFLYYKRSIVMKLYFNYGTINDENINFHSFEKFTLFIY